MQLVIDDFESQAPVVLHPEPMTDDQYFDFCMRYPKNFRIERTARGEIVIMPPTGEESSNRNFEICGQLWSWARRDGHGKGFDSNSEFLLPDGSALSPDAAWVSRSRLHTFTKAEKQKFLKATPEFIIELRSPSDRLATLKRKMESWMANGAQLGWLIDADRRIVYVYRPGREPEEIANAGELRGEGPVEGFVLNLEEIWAAL